MSGAAQSTETLHRVARAVYSPTYAAGAALARAQQELLATTDVVAAMGHTLALIIAAEHLADMASEAAKSLRATLAEQIAETGADDVVTMHHKAYLARKGAWVSIDQADMIPLAFMAPPIPDKKAIKAALEAGEDVPGCSIVRPNEQTLVIRSRK